MKYLVETHLQMPFLDDVGYPGNIDISLPGYALDNNNLEDLRKELNKYGLDLVEQMREILVLVIEENQKQ